MTLSETQILPFKPFDESGEVRISTLYGDKALRNLTFNLGKGVQRCLC